MLTLESGSGERRVLALLGGLCLSLSAVEYVIPRPLPFMRIGLANMPLLLALDIVSPSGFFLLALLKVLGQGIISGSLFSYVFLFSIAGTFSSAAVMFVLRRGIPARRMFCVKGDSVRHRTGFAGIGCAGAMISNGVQLLLARYLVFGAALKYLIPPFLAAGLVSGVALGIFCEIFCGRSKWYAVHTGKTTSDAVPPETRTKTAGERVLCPPYKSKREERRLQRRGRWNVFFAGGGLFTAAGIMALLFLFNPSIPSRVLQFVFFCFLAWFSGKKNNLLLTAAVIAGIVFFNLLVPGGKVLFQIGQLHITQGSLLLGTGKAVTLEGLVMLSSACIKSDLRLPGRIGSLLAESMRLLEFLREHKGIINRGSVIEGIDNLMLKAESLIKTGGCTGSTAKNAIPGKKQRIKQLLILLTIVLVTLTISLLFYRHP
ncbi:MAG: Gx transporter family protein [Treponema sp.]|nr:Gx transporter family protein [Treponema sp.]